MKSWYKKQKWQTWQYSFHFEAFYSKAPVWQFWLVFLWCTIFFTIETIAHTNNITFKIYRIKDIYVPKDTIIIITHTCKHTHKWTHTQIHTTTHMHKQTYLYALSHRDTHTRMSYKTYYIVTSINHHDIYCISLTLIIW